MGDLEALLTRKVAQREANAYGADGHVTRSHWDPFEGELNVTTPDASAIRKGMDIPPWVSTLGVMVTLSGIVYFIYAQIAGGNEWIGVVLFTLGFALAMGAQILSNQKGRETIRRVNLANKMGWSYTGRLLQGGYDGEGRKLSSPRAERIAERRHGLAMLTPPPDGEFWGRSEKDDEPFWIGISTGLQNAALGARRLRRDRHGGKGANGFDISMSGAYRLGRSTDITALIAPESIVSKAMNGEDVDTESAEFSQRFHSSVVAPNGARAINDADKSRLLRILSPATQATLIDLADTYVRCGFIVDDDVLYFHASDTVVGKNASQEGLDRIIPKMVADFERAKFSIKNYVE